MLNDFSFLKEGVDGMNLISTEDLMRIMKDKNTDYFLIDVRSPEEFNGGHLDGAINWTHIEIMSYPEQLIEKFKSNKKIEDTLIITYCMRGIRSGSACASLMQAHKNLKIANLLGGLMEWKKKEGQIV